ncbi:MAG: cyclic nucleotide-binding domain-containing protein, partial [Anaerolineae bacterium]|nr:cyclic nucleotide-binding domain-containing protein [Anaerolineae bacterium]
MAESQFLSKEIIARLQTVQKDLQKRSKTSEKSKQADSALKEFLETSGSKLEFKAGEILFLQDDLGEGMYWIESGQLVVLQGDLDDPQLLTFRFPGQVVGEIALLEDVQRSASVAAMTATRLRYLSKEKFQTFLTH